MEITTSSSTGFPVRVLVRVLKIPQTGEYAITMTTSNMRTSHRCNRGSLHSPSFSVSVMVFCVEKLDLRTICFLFDLLKHTIYVY